MARTSKAKAEKSPAGQFLELVVIVAVALGLALIIQALLVKPYRIPSESMVPTLEVGQRVLVNRLSTRLSADPEVGEIVVFHPPSGAEGEGAECGNPTRPEEAPCDRPSPGQVDTNFIKRVVGGPGDRIRIVGGRVMRNGKRTDEPFIRLAGCEGGVGCDFPTEITIPKDHYFMMGDNRGESQDSRFWGPVPREQIIGGAFGTYWPIDRIGLL